MTEKTIVNNRLKLVMLISSALALGACSTSNSEDWPTMQADNLWQELERAQQGGTGPDDVVVDDAQRPSLEKPGVQQAIISLPDIRVRLSEIERDLPLHAEAINDALQKFENAPDDEKDVQWRGVEVLISRLNTLSGGFARHPI